MQQPEQADNSVLMNLYRHNTWANLKLLDFCAGLPDEHLDTTANSAYGSMRDTLLHLVGAEVRYVRNATGKQPAEPLPRDRFPGFEMLQQAVRWTGVELLQMAVSARADTMVRRRRSRDNIMEQYTLPGLLVQVLNHASEHREQVSAMITQLGLQPPDMSGWQYMTEMHEYQEIPDAGS